MNIRKIGAVGAGEMGAGIALATRLGKAPTAMRLGTHHPKGPLELADFIGLDT